MYGDAGEFTWRFETSGYITEPTTWLALVVTVASSYGDCGIAATKSVNKIKLNVSNVMNGNYLDQYGRYFGQC